MQIDQGLFKLDVVDYHAVLGVSLEADSKQVRKRYLKIARKLHPDSLRDADDTEKQRASELLSKLVNPAYETLSQEKSTVEHGVLLRLKGQQLKQQPILLQLNSEPAKALFSSNNLEYDYDTELKRLRESQYESLEDVLAVIGAISELNAVYVMRKGDAAVPTATSGAKAAQPAATAADAPTETASVPRRRRRDVIIDSYLNRAKAFEYKQDYSRAIVELREAIKSHPDSARCHSYLASLYFKAGQAKMASIHCKRALELKPDDAMGMELQKRLNMQTKRSAQSTSQKSTRSSGFLGGLFGKKGK
ncbi:MAG: DnaJ domain-containing protein [Leptolyngbya sp. SIO4C1]|nr:DnaJ domain-containing protein [Leptolyngbya sp. SIO4C1]